MYVQQVGLFASLSHEERITWGENLTCFWLYEDDKRSDYVEKAAWDGVYHEYMMNWLVISTEDQ